eukprot:scaffold1645_cov288-Pavlova_lutheri.AAC.11
MAGGREGRKGFDRNPFPDGKDRNGTPSGERMGSVLLDQHRADAWGSSLPPPAAHPSLPLDRSMDGSNSIPKRGGRGKEEEKKKSRIGSKKDADDDHATVVGHRIGGACRAPAWEGLQAIQNGKRRHGKEVRRNRVDGERWGTTTAGKNGTRRNEENEAAKEGEEKTREWNRRAGPRTKERGPKPLPERIQGRWENHTLATPKPGKEGRSQRKPHERNRDPTRRSKTEDTRKRKRIRSTCQAPGGSRRTEGKERQGRHPKQERHEEGNVRRRTPRSSVADPRLCHG